ncbi:4Fe-4S dicluster domain-containing protein [Desulforhopalus vacuolatus]|uniref:4Fe-4S dicluster domain-containing protein n=1 Tax=Desulforhopalus vacuolatus TaxID=40414 RepID=UPI001963ED00|nr:4Fe-4S dicluster domain-containing protein [Desulforhopalus vacuolatus]MBM9520357.1 4Fe-4S dicluster domain-containing protein [Desulforhopalus vacuolatus]
MKSMTRGQWFSFTDSLIQDNTRDIIGVQSKGKRFHFALLENAHDLRLDHDVTLLPPKKFLLPTHEELIRFDISRPFEVSSSKPDRAQILIGVHPYDVIAIQQLDAVYQNPPVDDIYAARRKNTLIIASDILTIASRSFAGSLGNHVVTSGYDLLVTDLGDIVVIDEGTSAGRELLKSFGECREALTPEIERVTQLRAELPGRYRHKLKVDKWQWTELLLNNSTHPLWEKNARKCLSCGTCTLVCPTCFCYDVDDVMDINMKEGTRVRTWDSCLLRDFTLIGSGEIFRQAPVDRYRHRFYRKGVYLPQRFGFVACVGCGRCATQCLSDIADPLNVMNTLAASSVETRLDLPIPHKKPHHLQGPIFLPKSATIIRREKMTQTDTFYEIELDSRKPLGHQPGQFVEVSIFGMGEAPISVASAPEPGRNSFDLLVRSVGNVTTHLQSLTVGDKIGIRGPFGNGFDAASLRKRDLMFIAGGCGMAPMRSLVKYVLAHRSEFGEVSLLYGCKDPDSILFNADLNVWKTRTDIVQKFTVDDCPAGASWDGNIGVITDLIPLIDFDPGKTTAIIVGPPVMYRFVIKNLKDRGMPDDNIIVSLERRMKCGVGKCGHCQINGVYVCLEGPVFNYADIKDLPEAF